MFLIHFFHLHSNNNNGTNTHYITNEVRVSIKSSSPITTLRKSTSKSNNTKRNNKKNSNSTTNSNDTTELTMNAYDLCYSDIKHISFTSIPQFRQLIKLNLAKNSLCDSSVSLLCKALQDTRIKSINLTDNRITASGMGKLAQFSKLKPSLEELIVSCNPIGDHGLYAMIRALKKGSRIQSLTMRRCGITRPAMASLFDLLSQIDDHSISLRRIHIQDNPIESSNTFYYHHISLENLALKIIHALGNLNIQEIFTGVQASEEMIQLLSKTTYSNPFFWGSDVCYGTHNTMVQGKLGCELCKLGMKNKSAQFQYGQFHTLLITIAQKGSPLAKFLEQDGDFSICRLIFSYARE
jgi:hypothetical protein